MTQKKKPSKSGESSGFLIDLRSGQPAAKDSYREQALRLFPHVCAKCGREFEGKQLRELTVHHKDNNHLNNPPDGANWELLCLYCHDDEHEAYERAAPGGGSALARDKESTLAFRPFAGLEGLVKPQDDTKRSE